MNIVNLFDEVRRNAADRPALIGGAGNRRRTLTFGELNEHVDAVVQQLLRHDLAPGDRVLLAVPASVETYVVMLALLKAGMVIMFIDPAHSARRVARILRAWPPTAIVATKSILMLRYLMPELARAPHRFCVDGRSNGAVTLQLDATLSGPAEPCPRKSVDSALLTFTSGSTSEPKAVVRTHGFLCRQLEILEQIADVRPDDIDFVAMPMFVLFNLANGMVSVIPACDLKQPTAANPRIVYEQMSRERTSRVVASPALLERLADYCLERALRLPGMRLYSTGGGPVHPSLPDKLAALSPGSTVRMVYGSTEAEPIATIDSEIVSVTDRAGMRHGKGLLVGRPVQGCDTRIVTSTPGVAIEDCSELQFEALCCSRGEIGEITVAGRHVLDGYADASRDPETKIRVGGRTWHRTGDAGYLDRSGRLWLVGRCSAAINDRYGTVFPFQVEYALSSARGVRRVAFIHRHGFRTLVIEAAGRQFSAACSEVAGCIAEYRVERIQVVGRIPTDRRHNAKIDYPALERLLDGRFYRSRLSVASAISRCFRYLRWRGQSLMHGISRHLEATRRFNKT
jgi:acyl-CoA synthetase (AMP-forming)/AMP-acid ligase II